MSLLENSESSLKQKLQEAQEEVEKARKSCREYQFRIKQLQEQCTFLEKSKKKDKTTSNNNNSPSKTSGVSIEKNDSSANNTVSSVPTTSVTPGTTSLEGIAAQEKNRDPTQDPECDAPSWMK